MTPESPDRSIGRTAARLARSVDVGLMGIDLSAAQYRMLLQLAEGSEASTSLAKKLAVTAPSVTAVVDGLVHRGLVDRRHSEEDRRRVALTLTPEGRETLALADSVVSDRLFLIAEELDADERQQAFAGLEIWKRALDSFRSRRIAAQLVDQAPVRA